MERSKQDHRDRRDVLRNRRNDHRDKNIEILREIKREYMRENTREDKRDGNIDKNRKKDREDNRNDGIVAHRKDNRFVILKLSVLLVIIVLGSAGLLIYFRPLFSNLNELSDLIRSFGVLAPIAYILIVILQVLFAPIPGQAMGLASGFVFGAFFGTIYSMIGLGIGSWIAFLLSRRYGRPFVERVCPKDVMTRFDSMVHKGGVYTLFLIFLLPALPDDAVCYIAGLTKISVRTLVIITIIGRLPGFIVLNLIGDGLASDDMIFSLILFSSLMVISLLIFIFRKRIEEAMRKLVVRLKGFPKR